MTPKAFVSPILSLCIGLFMATVPINVALGGPATKRMCAVAYVDSIQQMDFRLGPELGVGADGRVFRVFQNQTPYVIKVFHDVTEISRSTPQIAIQELLAEHGYAPKIIKILDADDLDAFENFNKKSVSFLKWHTSEKRRFQSLISSHSSAIIMEEVAGQSFKNPDTGPHHAVKLSRAQLAHAIEKIFEIDTFVRQAHIFPNDLDVVITPEGDIKFIDLSKFKYTEHGYDFARRIMGDLLYMHVTSKIEIEGMSSKEAHAMIAAAIERARQ